MGMAHALDVPNGKPRVSAAALTLATVQAARGFGLVARDVSGFLGNDITAAGELLAGERMISPDTDVGARAVLFVRLHRALGDVYGSIEQVRIWLTRPDPDLDARPLDVLRGPDGLERLVGLMETRCKDCLW